MRSAILVLAASLSMAAAAHANPVSDRQALMKEFSRVARDVAPFARGQLDYDAAAVQVALEGLKARAELFDVETLFPAGSESGDGTEAAPTVWSDRAGFLAAVNRFKADISAAVAARPQDRAVLEPLFGAVGDNCGGCHRGYRL
ncbi:MAG: cytochrome c [Rhizobiaceae bacterium]